MEGLSNFIEVDKHHAEDVGSLRRGTKKLRFSDAYPEADIREGADDLTVRAGEVGSLRAFIDTTHIEHEWWGPPPEDADWHAFCQAVYKGIEGQEWDALCYHCKELHWAVRRQMP